MGPTSSVLLKKEPNSLMIARIYQAIDDLAAERTGDDFYISSTLVSASKEEDDLRPFRIDMNCITDEEHMPSITELKFIETKFGFYPQYEIGLMSMCNDGVDHKILGLLTLKVAEMADGIINFHGELGNEKIKNIAGRIYGVNYEIGDGRIAQYHVSDVAFMENWLRDDSFRMIK